jgi:hypothetical protein
MLQRASRFHLFTAFTHRSALEPHNRFPSAKRAGFHLEVLWDLENRCGETL